MGEVFVAVLQKNADDGAVALRLPVGPPDFAEALALMATQDVNSRWQAEMACFFEDLEGRRPDEGMLRLEEIFHLE